MKTTQNNHAFSGRTNFMRYSVSIFISLALLSCSRLSEEELHRLALEAFKQERYAEAAQHLEQLAEHFPQGQRTEESLFLLGNIYNDNLQNPRLAISTYRRLHTMFPKGEKAPGALFLVGFIYNNVLQNYDSARIVYEQFLAEFPHHEMAASAKFELDHLGKSPDELFPPQVAEEQRPKEQKAKQPGTSRKQ